MVDHPQKRTPAIFKIIAGISILTVAMVLLFPLTDLSGIAMARKVAAKNDVLEIVNAVRAFYKEYGIYPVDPDKVIGTKTVAFRDSSLHGYLGDNSAVLDVLRNNTTSPANGALVAKLNSRGIVFIELPLVKDDSYPRSGIHSTSGIWYDPWGSPYNLAIATASNDQIPAAAHGYTDAEFSIVRAGVIAWSYGKDRKAGKRGNRAYANSDDVISWQ